MILENTFERRAVNDYRRLKRKEKYCLESIEKAVKDNEAAWKSGDDALMQAAGKRIDQALDAHEAIKKELDHAAWVVANLSLDAKDERVEGSMWSK